MDIMAMAGCMVGSDNENNDLENASRCFPMLYLNKGTSSTGMVSVLIFRQHITRSTVVT